MIASATGLTLCRRQLEAEGESRCTTSGWARKTCVVDLILISGSREKLLRVARLSKQAMSSDR